MISPWLSTILQSATRPFKWWVVVAEWEQGLRVRLGKNTKLLKPGAHLRIPFLDRVFVQSIRTQVVNADNQTVSSKDGKVITYTVGVRFSVRDVKKMYNAFADLQGALMQDVLAQISNKISTTDIADLSPLGIQAGVKLPDYTFLDNLQVRIIGFAVTRAYRMISGSSWIPQGNSLDLADHNGERT